MPQLEHKGQPLIVNADDFGIAQSTNRAIIDCHDAGAVSSTTLMANLPAAEHAVAMARQRPRLSVGLHVNLTLGSPVCSASALPTLVNAEGRFYGRTQFERRAALGKIAAADVEREITAQLRRCRQLGIEPSHLDSHQHVHVLPVVSGPFLSAAARARKPVRVPWALPEKNLRPARMLRRGILSLLTHKLGRTAGRLQVRCNDRFGSIFDLVRKPADIALPLYAELLRTLAATGGIAELMVHPAYDEEDARGLTQIAETSLAETAILLSAEFRELLAASSFRLVGFSELASR